MKRQTNIGDFIQYQRSKYNPIFDLITDEFDNNFKEKSLDTDTIVHKFYTNARQPGRISDKGIMTLFAKGENAVTATDDFTTNGAADESIYLLLGKKGVGKTMLLYNFYTKAIKGQIDGLSKSDLVIYLDLRDLRSNPQFISTMPSSLMDHLFYWIYEHSSSHRKYLADPAHAKKICDLYKHFSDQTVCARILDHKEEALRFLFGWLKSKGTKVFLIVDNLDDFTRGSIITIFDLCHRLKTEYSVKSCLALRDYWNPNVLRIDDKPVCTITLPPPNVYEIVKKRIYTIDHGKISHGLEFTYKGMQIELTTKDLLDMFNHIIEELSSPEYQDLYNKLHRLTNFNTREFLINIYHYFHSPYLFSTPNFTSALVTKIVERDPEYQPDPPRELRLHDFIQNCMAIHSLCYDPDNSIIFNLFHHKYTYPNGYSYRNVLIFVRILQILGAHDEKIDKTYVVENLCAVGYSESAILNALDRLLKASLVESVDGIDANDIETVKLSIKGRLYLDEVIGEYTYLLFISDAVPMEEQYRIPITRKFGNEAIIFQRGNLSLKHESVRKFIEFVRTNEEAEAGACPRDFKEVLMRVKTGRDLYTVLQDRAETAIRFMSTLTRRHKHYGITNYRVKTMN